MTYWHYTCNHGFASLGDRGLVLPAVMINPDATAPSGLWAWFTDLSVPIRDALGLTQHLVKCDRTAHRYRVVDAGDLQPWRDVRRQINPVFRGDLESAPGARPRHWYVAELGVPVVLDERPTS